MEESMRTLMLADLDSAPDGWFICGEKMMSESGRICEPGDEAYLWNTWVCDGEGHAEKLMASLELE